MAECVQVAVSNATFHLISCILTVCRRTCRTEFLWAAWCLSRSAAARLRGWAWCSDWMRREAAGKRLKSLYDAAPEQARLSDELLRLVYYLKEHTFCTYYEAVKAIIPYGAQYKAVNTGPVPQLQKQLVRHTDRYTGAQTPPGRDAVPKSSRLPGTRWLSAPKHRRSWKSRA